MIGVALAGLALVAGCNENNAKAQSAAVENSTATQVADQAEQPKQKAKVAKIVFVGKKEACDCTRTRVDEAWKVLQSVLGKPSKVPVERLRVDTDEEKVAPYRNMRPMAVLPAIYFLDKNGKLNEMLQGEVTAEQIKNLL